VNLFLPKLNIPGIYEHADAEARIRNAEHRKSDRVHRDKVKRRKAKRRNRKTTQ
jgi:hypothetical protein